MMPNVLPITEKPKGKKKGKEKMKRKYLKHEKSTKEIIQVYIIKKK